MWHFTIGGITIFLKTKLPILLLLLLIACTGVTRKSRLDRYEERHSLQVQVTQPVDEEKVQVEAHIQVPNSYFIFIKEATHFTARVEFTLTVKKVDSDELVLHRSWKESFQVQYFEDTRDRGKSGRAKFSCNLSPDTYRIAVIIQDLDSKRKWQAEKEVTVEYPELWSNLYMMIRHDSLLVPVDVLAAGKVDTVFLVYSALAEDSPEQVYYRVKNYTAAVDSGKIIVKKNEENSQRLVPIELDASWLGEVTFELELEGETQTVTVEISQKETARFLNNIDLSVKVMSLVFSHEEFQYLKDLPQDKQRDYLIKYWKEQDPTPDTPVNELMEEFFDRVDYANTYFGTLSTGWRSDQGRIYIKFGKPIQIDTSQPDTYGRVYQIWHYPMGRQFIFLDDGFGEYRLVREIN